MTRDVTIPDTPAADLDQVVREVIDLTGPSGTDTSAGTAPLRGALERALDLLLATAVDPRADAEDARSSMALRDAIASHLRAVDELSVADARPERRVDLLLRAAELLGRRDAHDLDHT